MIWLKLNERSDFFKPPAEAGGNIMVGPRNHLSKNRNAALAYSSKKLSRALAKLHYQRSGYFKNEFVEK
jgi:hypothetical protein